MPVAKLLASSTPDAMKAEEGNDSLDTFIRQAVGKEPFFSFSRTGDSPVQWIQLLHALDQQDLPGWPLLTPLKVQMQKCEKCAREFCSPINYRRHIRVHRRSLNVDKESHKNRDLFGAFWDSLTLDEAKEVMSFKDVTLGEVPGSSVIRAITSNLRKPGFLALPQVYVKAGSILVDIIQGRPSRLPISSQELFSILDDASERTFLCAGTAESMQKYVFDGDAGKIGLDTKNLIACTSFLVEQRLVKAWLAQKDAEALRCQKLLVEEEEADQKRQAELLERKRQRKLRQKEQRAKDQSYGEKIDVNGTIDIFESPLSTETSSPPAFAEADSYDLGSTINHVHTSLEAVEILNSEEDVDIEAQGGCSSEFLDSGTCQNAELQNSLGNGYKHLVITRWQVPKSQKGGRNGFHASHNNVHMLKREAVQKHGLHRDQRSAPINGSKVWTKKPKSDTSGEFMRNRIQNDATNQTDQANCQLMIGSISVTVRTSTAQRQVSRAEAQDSNGMELKKNNVQSGSNHSTAKLWRPRQETRGQLPDRSGSQVSEDDVSEKGADRTMPSESCPLSCEINGNDSEGTKDVHPLVEDGAQPEGLPFSSDAAKAFLAQRWKEAISGDHVKLVISSEPESPCHPDATKDNSQASDSQGRSILGSAENRLTNAVGVVEPTSNGNGKTKFTRKPEKGGVKRKYIPKQRTVN